MKRKSSEDLIVDVFATLREWRRTVGDLASQTGKDEHSANVRALITTLDEYERALDRETEPE